MASAIQHPNHQLISSEDVEGTEVYDLAGKNIGEVDHLMIDKMSGRVAYGVISFGGFMGLGHSHYPVPWGALKYDTSQPLPRALGRLEVRYLARGFPDQHH